MNEVLLNASFRVVPNVRLHALERRIFGTNKSEAHGEGFNALHLDCEGCACSFVEEHHALLLRLRLVIVEADSARLLFT